MGKSIGSLVFNFGANLSGFDKALNRAQKRIKKFGKSMQKAGATMTRNVTLPLLGLGAAALKFGSDLEETDSKFQQVFSSVREEAEKTAKTFQDTFGLSELSVKTMLSGTGDLLVGFGFTEQAALDLSEKVNALAVDVASFSNFSGGSKGASESLTKALLGETESAKSLGIVIRQGTKEYKARTKALMAEKGISEMQAKALNNLEIMYKQTTKAQGDAVKTMNSFANQARKLKENLITVAAAFGEHLIPFAKAAIEKLQKLVEWFSGLSDSTKKTIVVVGLFVGALGPFLIVLGKMATGFAASKLAVAALIRSFGFLKLALLANPATAILTGLAIAVGFLATKIGTMDTAVRKSDQLYEDLIDKKERLAKLDDAELRKQKAQIETLLPALKEELKIANQLEEAKAKTVKAPTGTMMMMGGEEGTAGAQEATMMNFQLEKETKHRREIQKQITKHQGDLKAINELLGEGVKIVEEEKKKRKKGGEEEIQQFSLIEDRYGNMITLSKELMDSWRQTPIVDELKDIIVWQGKVTEAVDEFGEAWQEVEDTVSQVFSAISGFADAFSAKETRLLENDKKRKEDSLDSEYNTQLDIINRSISDEKRKNDAISALDQEFAEKRGELADNMETKEKEMQKKQALRNKAIGIMDAIIGTASAVVGALGMKPFTPFNLAMAAIVGGLGAAQIAVMASTPIPEFAEGGLVTGPTTTLIGEGAGTSISNPEVVAPLDKLKSMIGGGNQNIVVTGKIVGNDIWLSNAKTQFNRLRTT